MLIYNHKLNAKRSNLKQTVVAIIGFQGSLTDKRLNHIFALYIFRSKVEFLMWFLYHTQ